MTQTIADLHQQYDAMCGTETPARSQDELRGLLHAADLGYGDLDAPERADAFWTLAFGDDEGRWADGSLDWPTETQWTRFRAAV